MAQKELFAEKHLTKLNIEGNTYFRVYHHLAGMITGVSVFAHEQDPDDKKGVFLTELYLDDAPEKLRKKIISNEYAVEVLDEDKDLIANAFETKMNYLKSIADKKITVGLKRRLMEFIEVGGHYFGYVYEEGMPYTKFYQLNIDPVEQEVYVQAIPPEMLPALVEALSVKILSKTYTLTIQVGEGVYARISKVNKKTAVVTVVAATESDSMETSLKVMMGFLLKRGRNKEWSATVIKEKDQKWVNKEMEMSFEAVYQDLLVKVYAVHGEATLDVYK